VLACVGWLVGGVRVLVFLVAFDKATGLPSGPFCLLLVDADMSIHAQDIRRAPRSLLTNNWLERQQALVHTATDRWSGWSHGQVWLALSHTSPQKVTGYAEASSAHTPVIAHAITYLPHLALLPRQGHRNV
jgi:hypothetical protein